MADSGNFLGLGASQPIGKPVDYYKQIDEAKRERAEKSQKVIKSRQSLANAKNTKTQKNSPSSFQKMVQKNLSSTGAATPDDKNDINGTDLALKKISSAYSKQVNGILWNMAFNPPDKEYEGGLGEKLFSQELVMELVKISSSEDSPMAKAMYNELKQKTQYNNESKSEKK